MNQKYIKRYGDIHFMLKQIFYFYITITTLWETLERLSLSLFMSRIGTNHYNSSAPTDQSTFFTNFTNRSPYFHISFSLLSFLIYSLEENKSLVFFFFLLQIVSLMKGIFSKRIYLIVRIFVPKSINYTSPG